MTDKVNVNAEMLRRQEYVRKIIRAVNYKGNNDCEDVPSILWEYQEENLDLINRLKAENDELQHKISSCNSEIERLRENNQKLYEEMAERQKEEVAIAKRMGKTEGIIKFAERVKELSISRGFYPVITKNILNEAKAEMGVSDSGN